jgi:hypothetical protein
MLLIVKSLPQLKLVDRTSQILKRVDTLITAALPGVRNFRPYTLNIKNAVFNVSVPGILYDNKTVGRHTWQLLILFGGSAMTTLTRQGIPPEIDGQHIKEKY